MNWRMILAILVLSVAATARAQESRTAPQPAFGPELPYTEVLTPPPPVDGMSMPLMFSSENPRDNFLAAELGFAGGYDDNLLFTPRNHVDDGTYSFLPRIAIGQSRGPLIWNFAYAPAFIVNQQVSERNQTAQSLHLLVDYRLTQHVALRLRDEFSKTNSLFSGLMSDSGTPGPGPIDQPNASVLAPLADSTGNSGGLDLTYQFSPRSMVGTGGTYNFTNYAPIPGSGAGPGYIDSDSWIAAAFYAHRFTNRHWAGVTYNLQRFTFAQGFRTDVDRVLLFYSLPIGSQMTLSAWAGPEFSTTDSAIAPGMAATHSDSQWTPAAGLAWVYQGNRTRFRVGYRQQISDGGGLATAVTMVALDGEAAWRMTSRWTASVRALYGNNDPLARNAGVGAIRSWTGQTSLDYRIGEHVGVGFHYGHDQQRYLDSVPSQSSNRNRAWISLTYGFSRPLGR